MMAGQGNARLSLRDMRRWRRHAKNRKAAEPISVEIKRLFLHHRSVLDLEQAHESRSLRMHERTTVGPVWKPPSTAWRRETEITGNPVVLAIGNFLLLLSELLPSQTNLVECQADLILVNIKKDFCAAEKS